MTKAYRISRLTAIMFMLTVIAGLTACGGVDARKQKHLSKGQEYYNNENYEKARLEFSNVLKIDPKHVLANLELARTFEKLGKVRQAGGFYLKVLELDPANSQAMVRLGRIYLLANLTAEAESMNNKALELAPNDADVIALRGGIHARHGRINEAVADATRALSIDPKNLDALSLMAGIHIRDQKFDEAARVIEEGIKQNQKNLELRQLLSSIYLKLGERDKAVAVLKELVTMEPDKLPVRIQLAEFHLGNNAADEAEKIAVESVAHFKDDQTAKRYHVDLIRRRGDASRSEEQLIKYIEQNAKDYDLQFMLAGIYAGSNRANEAVAVLEKIIKNDRTEKHGLMARNELAKHYASINDSANAEKLVNEVLKESPQDSDALILRGNLALAKGDYTTAIVDLRAALRNQPNQASLLRQLAKAHDGNGEKELARQTYQTAITAEPQDITLYLEYTAFLMNTGDTAQALKTLDTAATIAPDDRRILEAKFNVYLNTKDGKSALKVAEKLKETATEKTRGAGHYAAGIAYQLLGDNKNAKISYARGLELEPDSPQLLTAYARNLMAMKQTDEAIKFLKDKTAKNPNNAAAHNLLGEIYLSQKNLDGANKSFAHAQQALPEWPIPYRNQALAHLQANQLEEAIKAYQHGYEQTKGDPGLGYALASLYEQVNRSDDAIRQFETLLEKSPNSDMLRNNLAMMLVTYRTDAQSLDKARNLVEPLRKTTDPNYQDTVGWVLYKKGEVKEAIPYLQKAAEKTTLPVIRYHLGMALYSSGDKPAARPHLEAAIQSPQPFKGMDEAKVTLRQIDG